MHCDHCGHQIPDDSRFCPQCGQTITAAVAGMPAVPGAPPNFSAIAGPPLPGQEPQTSGKAIASLVLGLLGFILPAAIAAIVLGHISRSEIQKSQGRLRGNGVALGGLILGYAGVALLPFLLIVAAIAIPNLLRARIAANEASAVASLRTIVTAQATFAEQSPNRGFTCELPALGPAAGYATDENHAGLIDTALAQGTKVGYGFRITDCDNGTGTVTRYRVIATPIQPGSTGHRRFCADQTGIIRSAPDAATECDENSPAL